MSEKKTAPFGLSKEDKKSLLANLRARKKTVKSDDGQDVVNAVIPSTYYKFEEFPEYQKLHLHKVIAEKAKIENPFFRLQEGIANSTVTIGNHSLINFANYNYLGLNGHPEVSQAAHDAIDEYGTSVSASRIVAGERKIHLELERKLAEVYDVDDAVVMVSGYATNLTVIGNLLGSKDLILYDNFSHNSILQGTQLSSAKRRMFPHNDMNMLDQILKDIRHQYERCLIVVEGVYSMDGDAAPLDKLVEIKKRHKCLLMVDEAHGLGVLGATGRGSGEHFGVTGRDVDIWMGTLSKTSAGCGGYIAGSNALIEYLKFSAPGFVYSVGMPPPVAAAALASLNVMLREPERIKRFRDNANLFIRLAKEAGLNTGVSQGHAVVPIIIGNSVKAGQLSSRLFDAGVYAPPIIYPAVPEESARLRFFLSSEHTPDQIREAVQKTKECWDKLKS
ncbi:aminotransferase class I/II-fold pyridoxal phosphate-dependent enzyme [Sneathiella chinensis]|uniref:Polyketide synthase n=1 Tax=Sneathiella chinensis TaxID=349750 RepID=A0ABQ5U255_9PROT|nr:aminotransferase class I/II-fold pyridoxal phosphate-dependent enzyme [Sneathiella chinensis]GLQ05776.1 polyketide synthase [Sneathiella chinensis]